MKTIKHLLLIVLTVFAITFCVTNVPADLGNHNSYSSHSSGGSSHSYGGGYSGGYSGGGYSSGYRSYGSSGGYASPGSWVIAVLVVCAIIALTYAKNKANGNSGNVFAPVRKTVPDRSIDITQLISKYDPNFSYEKFIGWAKEVFITLQMAWSERDFSKVRPFEKEELYRQHVMQIQEYINLGRINVLSRINVNRAYFTEYKKDNEYEYLTMYLEARMGDYIKDEKTGAVIKGDPNAEYNMRYLLTFIRKTGVLTDPAKSNSSTVACPHCGAPTQITSSGQCEYCGFIVTTGEFDWVLSNIDSIQD